MRNRVLACMGLGVLLAAGAAAQSQHTAAALFDKGMNSLTGSGLGAADMTALDYFHRAADLGYGPAQVIMGYYVETGSITFKGQPVGPSTPREPGMAEDWYKKAAQQGDRVAYWLLGRMYYTGDGVTQDLGMAEPWLQKAAALNDPFGQYLLGQVRRQRGDYAGAADLFRKASMQGLPQAQAQLGLLLKEGQGVNQDKVEACAWLMSAYDGGSLEVAGDLRRVEADLGSTLLEQARARAREFEQSTARALVAKGCTGWQGEFAAVPMPPPPDLQAFCR